MDKREETHVIDAIATYICIQARRNNTFITEIDTREFADILNATGSIRDKAEKAARGMIRDFI